MQGGRSEGGVTPDGLQPASPWLQTPPRPARAWACRPASSLAADPSSILRSLCLPALPNPRVLASSSPEPSYRRPRPSAHPSFRSLLPPPPNAMAAAGQPSSSSAAMAAAQPQGHSSSNSGGSSSGGGASNVVGTHYRVGKKIGEGSFGVIFEGPSSLPFA